MIRVSGGKYRSRILATPEQGTEPTKNRVREAMLSMVYPVLEGARVLDLFAGSGALGIESLSRGAKSCIFVDFDRKAASIVENNLRTLKESNGRVLNLDALAYLEKENEPFDLVFIDPPYANKKMYPDCLEKLLERNLLSPGANVLLEYEGTIEVKTDAFSFARDYTYGKTKVLLLRK